MKSKRSITGAERPAQLAGADPRLLAGYGPLVGLVVLFLVMVLLAPSVAPERIATATRDDPGSAAGPGSGSGEVASPGEDPGGLTTGGSPAVAGGDPSVEACPGFQVEGDPYSPPCATWAGGDNGGTTTPGVDAKTIRVTYRDGGLPDIGSLIGQFSGVNDYASTQADLIRTLQVIADHFNNTYELYGRRIEIVPFTGQGSTLDEMYGAGRAGAQADAVNASKEQHAFANAWTMTQPYGDALAANGVIALDNLFMSQPWANQRSPLAWNTFPDCTKSAKVGAELVTKMLAGKPAAFAGPDMKGKARKFAILAPDVVSVEPCVDLLTKTLSAAGIDARAVRFTQELGSLQNQGQQVASTLASDGVTTVLLLTDPASPFFFASGAQSARWTPEWVVLGQPYLDLDYLAQILPREQWVHALGVSFNGDTVPPRSSDAYRAYKAQSPQTEPSMLLLPTVYQELRLLAIGIQQAGPHLTPESFASGLRSYHETSGPDGTWAFPDGDHSVGQDVRIIWFDGNATSPTNGRPGAYRDDGKRYRPGSLPSGNPPIYLDGPP